MKLEVPVEFPRPKTVFVLGHHIGNTSAGPTQGPSIAGPSTVPTLQSSALEALPPLLLDVLLPATYPYSPPVIQSLHATHSWLPLSSELERMLLEMWQDGEGVLYSWIETIRSGEFLDSLGMSCDVDGRETIRYAQ